ncbi:DUF2793 domain-containing protein [Delftia sp. DLF01]|uniref:DUF2793 domain-containing protein n=1 Tax=Delftia sp. DLF01 TaxID=2769279 RepID=UPI0017804FD4|nr:DUF2793 domain-containing protein [Delftia sp. DLF01]MBD9583579.1 DUF2793 domain-containing protein [Delftia sp. DLF01]
MSTPILPFDVWPPGSNQASIPANDNALRSEILAGRVISKTTTAQPSGAEGAIYIIPAGATGAMWATFTAGDLALFRGGTWYAFAPVTGLVVHMLGSLQQWTGSAWEEMAGGGGSALQSICVAASDETAALTVGAGKVTFRMPYAFTLSGVRASLTTAQASGSLFTVDINESGASILSTKLTIDNTEKTSTTAAAPPVISDINLADDAEITIDIDQVGDGSAKGLKVYLIGEPA